MSFFNYGNNIFKNYGLWNFVDSDLRLARYAVFLMVFSCRSIVLETLFLLRKDALYGVDGNP